LLHIVLAGAGHANVLVLKKLAEITKTRGDHLVLVSDSEEAPYSGMIPGYMMNDYKKHEFHFPIRKICERLNIDFIQDRITGIDLSNKKLQMKSKPDVSFDCTSINLGLAYKTSSCNEDNVIPVKPISHFVPKWEAFIKKLQQAPDTELKLFIVGGGAAGVEISVAIKEASLALNRNDSVEIFNNKDHIAYTGSRFADQNILKSIKELGVRVHLNQDVSQIENTQVQLNGSEKRQFDYIFLTGQTKAPDFFKNTALATTESGFLKVNEFLQSTTHKFVFGAGDCVHFAPQPLPKAGVYPVRQAQVLAHNLVNFEKLNNSIDCDKALCFDRYQPQKSFLKLIHVRRDTVVGVRPPFYLKSQLLKKLKRKIDTDFMGQFD